VHNIGEFTVILREQIAIPREFMLETEKFCENWSFALRLNALQLEAKICAHGWGFIRNVDGLQASGVGKTSHEAIASALRLIVCHSSEHSDVAEVRYIELTHYPWFYLARMRAFQYRIQYSPVFNTILREPATIFASSSASGDKYQSLHTNALHRSFGSAMPRLKQMLVLSIEKHSHTRESGKSVAV